MKSAEELGGDGGNRDKDSSRKEGKVRKKILLIRDCKEQVKSRNPA